MAALETEIIFDPIFGARAVKKLVNQAEKVGDKAGDAFGDNFTRSADKSVSFVGNSFKNVFKGIGREAAKLGAIIGTGIAGIGFAKSIAEADRLETSLIGLKSIASGLGTDVAATTDAAKALASDGLIPLEDVTASLGSLLVNFNGDLQKSVDVFNVLKNSAAFNRQAQLGLGEAVRGASEGLKNDLSIKVDNAGITKNLSILQKEYAASIGTTIGRLTEQQKAQAEYVGILREGAIFQGDYNRLQETFSGVTTRAATSFKFLLAEFGSLITRSPAVIGAIGKIADLLDVARNNLSGFGGGDIGKAIVQSLINVGRAINDFVITPFTILGRVGSVVFQAVVTGLDTIVAAVGKLGGALAFVLEKVGLGGGLSEGLKTFSESSAEVLEQQATRLNESLTGIFDPLTFSEKTTEFLNILQSTVDQSEPILQSFSDKAVKTVNDTAKGLSQGAKLINKAIDGALAGGLSSAIQELGQRLGEGKSLFDDFGKFLFGLLGDVLVQVGNAAIAFGIATSAIQNLSPGVAIAAGAALVAVGSILKGLSGGSGGTVDAGASSAATSISPVGGVTPDDEGIEESRQEPDTNVSVTIQGDVLDSDETGTRIVGILNDAFEKDGVVVKGLATV